MAAIRLVRASLGDDAGLKKTQTEVLSFSLRLKLNVECIWLCFCFVLFLEQVRRLHGYDVSKELVRRVIEEAAAASSSDEDEAAAAAAAAKQKKREEDAAAAAKLKLENLIDQGEA